MLHQQAKFIPTQTGQGIALTNMAFEQPGNLAQQLIAGQVPTGVVDHLELV